MLEYFVSTHGARKGLADTALKTADAGYLTRRLVDVAQDVIINEEDCGTLRGLTATAIKRNDDVVQTLYDRILGRTALNDVIHPLTGEVICKAGQEITEDIAEAIEKSPLESVEIRSVLTCEARHGVCAKCYGRNLATARMVQKGEVVGVIAAQSIGEPGTQLTLRTFHVGGVAGGSVVETNVVSKYEGRLEIEELRTIKGKNAQGEATNVVISRQSEIRIVDPKTEIVLDTHPLPYGATLFMTDGAEVKKGDLICEWDPYNAVIISEFEGKASYENVIEGVTYREERDEQTGLSEKVVIESKDKTKNPVIKIINREGEEVKSYNLPVSAHVVVKDNAKIHAGDILIKIPRAVGKSGGDITGGLPRVTELFEARNPSNPAIVSEIDGEVSFGKIKRGNREIVITSKQGDVKRYLVPLSRQIIVQENDYVKAGSPLSDGAITPSDILRILGPTKVQEYIVNEVQEVYRMQGVKINDKHFEVIVRQMMSKVQIEDPGDTRFFEDQIVDKWEFMDVNDALYDKVVVTDAGDSTSVQPGRSFRFASCATRIRVQTQGHASGTGARHRARDLESGLAGYHPCGVADVELHLGRFVPGDHQGAQRGCDPGQGRSAGKLEGERDLRSPDPRRYGSSRVRRPARRTQIRRRESDCRRSVEPQYTIVKPRRFPCGNLLGFSWTAVCGEGAAAGGAVCRPRRSAAEALAAVGDELPEPCRQKDVGNVPAFRRTIGRAAESGCGCRAALRIGRFRKKGAYPRGYAPFLRSCGGRTISSPARQPPRRPP